MNKNKVCSICGQKLTFNNQGYPIGKEKICSDDNGYLLRALGYKLPLGIKDTIKAEFARERLPFEEAKNLIEQQKLKDSLEHQKALNQLRQQSELIKNETVIAPTSKKAATFSEPETETGGGAINEQNYETTNDIQTEEVPSVAQEPAQVEKTSKLEKAVEVTSMIGSLINTMRQPHCPNCRSTNIQVVGQHRKGFSVGKAAAGTFLSGGIGAIAGFAGKNTKKVDMICMDCGKKFRYKGK